MRRIVVVLLISSLAAGLLAYYFYRQGAYRGEDYDREVLETELRQRLAEEGVVSSQELDNATIGQLWLYANYGPEAFLAGKRYPEQTVTLYHLFGHTQEFQTILFQNGYEKGIPVVWSFFLDEYAHSYEIQDLIAKGVAGFAAQGFGEAWKRMQEAWKNKLTPDERAWIAVNRIWQTKGSYLAQFVVDSNGVARRSQVARAFATVEEIFLGDIEAIEWKYKSGEVITASEAVGAAVEVAFLAAVGAKTLLAFSKAGKIAAVAGKTTKAAKSSSLLARTSTFAPALYRSTAMRWGVAGVGGYLLWHNRAAFNSGIAVVAETIGINPLALQAVFWLLLIAVPFYFLSFFLFPLITLLVKIFAMAARFIAWLFPPRQQTTVQI